MTGLWHKVPNVMLRYLSLTARIPAMSRWLYRLGRASVRRRWLVLGAWIAAVVLIAVLGKMAGAGLEDKFEVPGTEAQQARDLLQQTFPA